MRAFYLICLSSLLGIKVSAQVPPKRQLLFSPPGINIAIGGPTHDLVREDRLDLGFSFEYPATTLWYIQDEKVGILVDASIIFYQAHILTLRQFLWDNTKNVLNDPEVVPIALRSPQIHLGLSFKIKEIQERQVHAMLGYVLKTNTQILDQTYLEDYKLSEYDGYYGRDKAITDLYVATAKLNGTFHHIRFGVAALTKRAKVIGSLRVWVDYHPPYLLEYSMYEVSNPVDTRVTMMNKTRSQWRLGFRFEWYGLLAGKIY